MDCKPKLLHILIFIFFLTLDWANANGFRTPVLGNTKNAVYNLKPINEISAVEYDSNINALLSTAAVASQSQITVGLAVRSTSDLQANAQRLLQSLENFFSSPAGISYFREFPDVSIEPIKIFSDTSETVLTLSTTSQTGIFPATRALIQLLSNTPGIKFAGETRTISVD